MEYNAITHHADPVYASNKKHFKAEEDPLPDYLLPYFKRVIRITRLREVRVLLGFTRVDAPDPDADEQTNIVYLNKGKTENGFLLQKCTVKVSLLNLIGIVLMRG